MREIEATSFVSPTAIPQLADAEAVVAAPPPPTRRPLPGPRPERARARPRRGGRRGRDRRVHRRDRRLHTAQHRDDRGRVARRRSRRSWPGPASSAGGDGRTCRRPSGARTPAGSTRRRRSRSPSGSRRSASTRSASGTRSVSASRIRSPSWSRSPRPPASPSSSRRSTSTTRAGRRSRTSPWGSPTASGRSTRRPGGTGGCPYAPGAAGNLATEDLVYFLDASGWEHGVYLDGVLTAARFIAGALGKPARDEGRSGRRLGSGDGCRHRPLGGPKTRRATHRARSDVLAILRPRWTASCSF